MVDITIFELHVDDISVEAPWTDDDTDGTDDSDGRSVPLLGLAGVLGLLAVGVVVAWRLRSSDEDGSGSLD